MAAFAATYITDVREGRPAAAVEEKRQCVRSLMASFLLLDPDMIDAPGTIRADGLDRDVAAVLFALRTAVRHDGAKRRL
jgi:hypothetical protein